MNGFKLFRLWAHFFFLSLSLPLHFRLPFLSANNNKAIAYNIIPPERSRAQGWIGFGLEPSGEHFFKSVNKQRNYGPAYEFVLESTWKDFFFIF